MADSGMILAIDPGTDMSAYVAVGHDGKEIVEILGHGKAQNRQLYSVLDDFRGAELAVEMVASYGMAVGAEVFETCVWIGRLLEYWRLGNPSAPSPTRIYRRDEKLCLCGTMAARDSNIIQALVDRYAPGQPNRGKGTKKHPGFFYGFHADVWQAMAVAVTHFDKHIRGINF